MRFLLISYGLLWLLLISWVTLALSEWLPPPTDAQRRALELLESSQSQVNGERNAFARLWLFGYDIPEAELEQIAAADVQAFETLAAKGEVENFVSTAEGRYPAIPTPPGSDPALCEPWSEPCLTRVRRDPEGSRVLVRDYAAWLQRTELIGGYDHYLYLFQHRIDSPIGLSGHLINLPMTAAALDFVDGEVGEAFARLCHQTSVWRQLRANTDAVIVDLVGIAQMSLAAGLYAEILAELPEDFNPPCLDTFAVLTDQELNQCPSNRGDFLMNENSIKAWVAGRFGSSPRKEEPTFIHHAVTGLLNKRRVIAVFAEELAPYCDIEHFKRLQERDPRPIAGPEGQHCGLLGQVLDPVGCYMTLNIVGQIFNSSAEYYHRALDLDARLKLLGTAIWLHNQPDEIDLAGLYAQRPSAFSLPYHEPAIDLERNLLRIRNIHVHPERPQHWEIPIRPRLLAE